MQTLLETFQPDERRQVSVQLSPYLEWWVADGCQRERLRRSDVGFDVPESMRDTVLGLPHRATIRQAAEELVRTDSSGVAVLFDGTEVIALVPAWSGQSLYWAAKDGVLLLSTSARSIAKEVGADVNRAFLASFLVDGLPLGVMSRISPWDGVQAIAPFEMLRADRDLKDSSVNARPVQVSPSIEALGDDENDVEDGLVALRQALLEATYRRCAGHDGMISCDISGGVDSAANAYLLRSLHMNFDATHASSSSQYNLDDAWAKRIVNDVGASATFYPALGSTGLTFDAAAAFPNGYVPERPVMWCDTEGYAQALADRMAYARRPPARRGRHHAEDFDPSPSVRVQLMGLGGDELFAPLPAMAWSLAHQAPLRAVRLAISYCRSNRIPLRRGIPSIVNNVRYGRWLSRSMRELASKGKTPKDDMLWSNGFAFPSYMLNEAKELVRAPFDVGRLEPLNEDRSVNQALESLLGQAEIIRQVNEMFGQSGITWASIFVDPAVVRSALALPLKMRLHPYINKPSLYRAMRGLMPREIFARATKGEYTKDSYETFDAQRELLVDELAHGYVGQLGLIDRSSIKAKLSMRALPAEFLFELKRLVAAERWMRSVC